MSENKQNVRNLIQIAAFTALLAIMAQISIPMPAGVPMTMQTLAVPLAGLILGANRGTLATVLYVLLGIFGVPVFAGFSGGPGITFGITGGFIISFPVMAYLAGLGIQLADKIHRSEASAKIKSLGVLYLFLLIGAVVNYIAGMLWFGRIAGTGMREAFVLSVLPFIPTSIIKIVLAGWMGPLLRTVLRRAHVLETSDV